MIRACELCKRPARIHCESDQASLCWDCDAKVHSANFLVARHSRNLLCRLCQSPTPWSAAGSNLEPIFSNCRKCVNRRGCRKLEDENEEEAVEEEQEVVANQFVPWSLPPPPPASDSSLSGGEAVATRKRRRLENDGFTHDDLVIRKLPSDTAAEVASGAGSTISRETATTPPPPPRKVGRTDPCEVEVRGSKSSKAAAVTVSGKEMAEVVDLNLSLSLFSR